MQFSGSTPHLFQGTILAGGTLTSEIDLSDASIHGLIVVGMAAGTLSFQVSPFSETDPNNSSHAVYVDLRDDDGTLVSAGGTGNTTVDMQTMAKVSVYRYLKIKSDVAQTNGVKFYLPARG
jgi:hypothetical protein